MHFSKKKDQIEVRPRATPLQLCQLLLFLGPVCLLFFFFLPKLIFVLFAKWGPTWLAPLLIAVEAVHWFYRQYYTPLRHARKQNIDDALQIEMLLRWSVLLPWQLARHLQLNYMRHLWAMSIMHLWTGTITSLFFKTIAPLLLVIFGTDGHLCPNQTSM